MQTELKQCPCCKAAAHIPINENSDVFDKLCTKCKNTAFGYGEKVPDYQKRSKLVEKYLLQNPQ